MAIGLSIHIGLNEVDARHYGSPCKLKGCEADAHAMRKLAVDAGFDPIAMLLGPAATSQAVLDAIRGAAPRIGGDGMLLVTYSGHGGQVRDVCGYNRGFDWDQTWCTHDRQLVKEELGDSWRDFEKGARVLVVSDSCFSGDMIRAFAAGQPFNAAKPDPVEKPHMSGEVNRVIEGRRDARTLDASGGTVLQKAPMRGGRLGMRALGSRAAARRIYNQHHCLYDSIQREVYARPFRPIEAQVLLLAASQDNEPAQDGDPNGAFTAALLEVWNGGAFEGNYIELHKEIYRRLVPQQRPVIRALRVPAFARDCPFAI